jgi:hypothetical protein
VIEKLKESRGRAFGFKVTGRLDADDVSSLLKQLDYAIGDDRHPFGLLADLSEMEGASWTARWEEMRFLQHHSDKIARMAVICNDSWEEVSEMVLVATAALQAQTLYFHPPEIGHAWHWVKMTKMDELMPVRIMYPGKGLFQNYTPEYMGI